MDYQLSGIKLNVYIGNQDRAKQELEQLIKKLENNKITIKVDFEDVKKQLDTVTKAYEKASLSQVSTVEKTQKEIKKIYATSNQDIKKMVESQRKILEEQYGNRGKVNYTYSIDEFGNNQITGAFVQIKNQAQETEKVMFGLRESIETVGNEIHKIYSFDMTGKKQVFDLKSTDSDLKKFDNTVSNTRKKYENEIQKLINKNSELANDKGIIEFQKRLERLDGFEFDDLGQEIKDIQLQFNSLKIGFQETGMLSKTSSNLFKRVGQYFTATSIYYEFAQAVKFGMSSIIDLDSAIVELSKTSSASKQELKDYMITANKTAVELATTTKDLIMATSDFSRMGFTELQDAEELARIATIYKNIGDDMTIDNATASMISTMQAFKIEAKDALDIVDKFNNVSNNFAISSKGIGEALQSSANALSGANNTLSESISLITTANITAQDPNRVGNAMKSISMRLRSINEESGELIPKMREMVLLQTNGLVDIMENEDTYKSTYTIIKELSNVWGELSDAQQAYLSKELAGVHRGDIFMGLMESAKNLDSTLSTAMNSSGSAMAEQEKYAQSLNAKINELRESTVLLWQTLIDEGEVGDFIETLSDIVKGTNEVIETIGGVTPALTSVIGLVVVLKSMSIADGLMTTGRNIVNVTKSMMSLSTGLKTTVAGMSAMKTTITGLTGAIGLITMAISAMVMYQNKQKQEQEEIMRQNKELAVSYTEEANSILELKNKYSEIYNSTDTTLNKKEELSKIQDILVDKYNLEKEGIDLVNGSYEKQIELLNGVITSKSQASAVLLDDYNDKLVTDIGKNTTYLGGKNKFTGEENVWKFNTQAQKDEFVKIANDINDAVGKELIRVSKNGKYDEYFINILGSPEERKKMLEMLISDMDLSDALKTTDLAKSIKNIYGDISPLVDEYIKNEQEIEKINKARYESEKARYDVENMSLISQQAKIKGINDVSKASLNQVRSLEQLYIAEKVASNGQAYATVAQAEFRRSMAETNEEYAKSIGRAKTLEEEIINVGSAYEVINDALDTQKDKIATYNDLMQKMQDGTYLTAEEMYKLVDSNAELAPMLEEVDGMYRINIESLEDLRDSAIQTTKDKIKADLDDIESVRNKTIANIKSYGLEIESLKSLAEARRALASSINSVMSGSGTTSDKYNQMLSQGLLSKDLDDSLKSYYEIDGKYKEIQAKMKALENMSFGTKTDKGGSSSSKKDNTISDKFKADLEEIKRIREQIEYEINLLQEKMNLAELTGDTKGFSELSDKMTVLKDKLRGISEIEISKFNGLAQIYKETEQLAELESLVSEARKQGYIDEQSYIQYTIDLINQKYDAEKRAYDDKLRFLNYEQEYTHEDSKEYADIEQQKLDMVVAMQKSCMDKVRELKEKGLSDENEDVRKYIDLYKDMLEEQLNLEKSMAEKRKQLELDRLNDLQNDLGDKQSAMKSYIDMVMQMLRDQYNEEKKMIEDNYKLKQDKLKQELDSYKKIIDAKKKSLEDEANTEDYNDEVSKRQKELADMKANAALLGKDETAKAQYEKLLEEIAQKEKDLAKYQRDHNIKLQQESLDKEYDIYEENINKELDALEQQKDKELEHVQKMLDSEVELRRRAIQLIEQDNDKLYKQLQKWAEETGKKTQEEVSDAWKGCTDAINTYNDGQMNVLDTLTKIADKLKEVKVDIDDVSNSHWTDFDNNPSTGNGGSYNKPSGGNNGSSTSDRDKKIEKMIEIGNQMKGKKKEEVDKLLLEQSKIAREIGAFFENDTWYLMLNGKKVPIRQAIGVRHNGLFGGRVGDGMKANEKLMKLTTDEWVINDKQYKMLNKNIDNLIGGKSNGDITITFDTLMKVDRIDKDVDIDALTTKATDMVFKKIKSNFSLRGMR